MERESGNRGAAGGLAFGAGAAVLALMASGKLKVGADHTPEEVVKEIEKAAAEEPGLLGALQGLQHSINTLAALMASQNAPHVTAFRVVCGAPMSAVRLPSRTVPQGKGLVIKAMPTNAGLIYVASSSNEVANINSAYPLLANEAVEYEITDSGKMFIASTVAGEGVVCTVEQGVF